MSYIKGLLTAFCAACVIIGALFMLCPDGALKKSVKYLLSLVFVLSIIAASGLKIKEFHTEFTTPEISINTISELDTASARFVYAQCLSSAEIDFSQITVCTDKSADGSIIISKVIIRSLCEREKIIAALGEAAKHTEVEVINE